MLKFRATCRKLNKKNREKKRHEKGDCLHRYKYGLKLTEKMGGSELLGKLGNHVNLYSDRINRRNFAL